MYLATTNPSSLTGKTIDSLSDQAIELVENMSDDYILNLYKKNLTSYLSIPDIQSLIYEALWIIDPICREIARICIVHNVNNIQDTYDNYGTEDLLDIVESDVKTEIEDQLFGFTDAVIDILTSNNLSFLAPVYNTTISADCDLTEDMEDKDVIVNDGQNILLEAMRPGISMYSFLGNDYDISGEIIVEYSLGVEC